MIPVVTPEEMARVDAAAPVPVETLIERAGAAVARAAIALMGGTYGRRIVVIAGRGNNGNDGRSAARLLRRRGAHVVVLDAGAAEPVPPCDLVIDAAYGTGFRGTYISPVVATARVLAVDIPSGVDGITGVASGHPANAEATVTFAALKPGLLYADGRAAAGRIVVADIGLDVGSPTTAVVESSDLASWVVTRPVDSHKWRSAVWVVGGAPGMTGAPVLAAGAAFAAGAGYVRLSSPGSGPLAGAPVEAVTVALPLVGWHRAMLDDIGRVGAMVLGPGLGRSESVRDEVVALATQASVPMVIDGDGLWAIAGLAGRMSDAGRVLTPHDGEFLQLTGRPPGADRVEAARRLAAERRAVVVLKGPTTTVASPDGDVRIITAGDQRLATAGTGDVLSGVIGALLAGGATPFDAAAAGAQAHAAAVHRCPAIGTTASLLPDAVSAVLSEALGPVRSAAPIGRWT